MYLEGLYERKLSESYESVNLNLKQSCNIGIINILILQRRRMKQQVANFGFGPIPISFHSFPEKNKV